ncbi:GntR family transcriptional regulator [Amycolatopsis mediterranei S699]|uniref:GntR family transcriptional regulator n=2 Tax=Amycolatopsis mediterranei TaxID=33910 RepID=A0A0H3DFK7_AMYMU|nr:FCD domain-containing protein [Amycolatopsis mediterranei]ADJ48878.1 GntR family transcriptional regulator [Amycolatopsis mediterranei U32]AEK45826.1 GntR family transcriptional regulator [Amycolatopsis mediterranei S699]AFO80586.1 GntR family transcriptional regulator [Amycolatopsis mediterranei S699]AGT87714.1 GntR family transcriptional regulator [Amycolatopsis mediterranei RB]KDU94005.1 GntR family transcriptional regulator [Amycolatopsis mediterranei]
MTTGVDLESADDERESDLAGAKVGTLAARIAHRIEADVVRRGWPVGESLGSELDLREHFGVSRSVLREAVRLVEHHQVARMRRGPNGGLLVCAPDAGPATRSMVIYLEYIGTSVTDLLQARLLLEPIAAGLAADQVTEEGIETLRATLEDELAHGGELGIGTQDPLHPLLGKLSGNPVLHLFIDVLTRLTARYAHTSRRVPKAEVASSKELSHEAHRAIADAVIAGDGARAQTTLTAHVEWVAGWIEKHRVQRTKITGTVIEPEMVEGPRAKLAEVVAARIHDDIAARGWQVGSALGSEADLLARYGISRAVLREAVRLLEYHSVARMRRGPGGGLIVAAPEPQASIDTMALFLEYQCVTADDLRIVRDAIELGTVARVTARHADGDAEVAERLAAAVRWPTEGPADAPRKADLFHAELAELAGNPVLSLFLSIITELFRRHAAGQDRPLPGDSAADEVQHVHQRILDAILVGDAGVARHRMRRHLDALIPWWH